MNNCHFLTHSSIFNTAKTMTEQQEKKPAPGSKEKLRTIMEAASALTALGDSDSEGSSPPSPRITPKKENNSEFASESKTEDNKKTEEKPTKRYIPQHKKPDAALTFPEKLMNMMEYAEEQGKDDMESYCISWIGDGKSFLIRHPEDFTRQVLPRFFKATKFSSFTRKLYRWGFRQLNRGIGPDDPIIFGNENFQKNNRELMVKMRSVTAASTRKTQNPDMIDMDGSRKRGFDVLGLEQEQRKRLLLDRLIQEKVALGSALAESELSLGGFGSSMHSHNNFNLASALRVGAMNQMPNPPHSSGMGGYPSMGSKRLGMMGMHPPPPGSGNFNLYPPVPSQAPPQHPPAPMGSNSADIVNAAINALRYAS